MRALSKTPGGASSRVLRLFYVQAVRACLDYAAPCLLTVTPHALVPLEVAQNAALRVILRAPRWTKCVCLRAEARICPVPDRVQQLATSHVAMLLRREGAGRLRAAVQQALRQAPVLFTRKTWPTVVATVLRRSGLQETAVIDEDAPHPAYTVRPPWAPPLCTTTIRPLPVKKALLTPHRLACEARSREREAARPGASVYYTDGSVNHLTGAVGAAFVGGGDTAMYRLSSGASSTQAELVAILGALSHAVERGGGPLLIHCDSMPAITSLLGDPLTDNISLLTTIQTKLTALEAIGRTVQLNWLPSHAGIGGNEAANRAAHEATLLPHTTTPITISLSQIKRRAAAAAADGLISEVRRARAGGSPSASWWDEATGAGTRRAPQGIPSRVSVNIHRLRLGYRCASVLVPDEPTPVVCPHCEQEVQRPLLHYLLQFIATRPPLPNPEGHSAPSLLNTISDDCLMSLVQQYAPPY